MTQRIKDRIKSFLWRAGVFCLVAGAGYLSNIADIRDIDWHKLLTLFLATIVTFIVNEITKHMNTPVDNTLPPTPPVVE